jgi:hypothetical protein
LGSTIEALGVFEIGKVYRPPFSLRGDVAGALIVNTIFGPVEIGGAVGDYGHAKFFFQVGRIFGTIAAKNGIGRTSPVKSLPRADSKQNTGGTRTFPSGSAWFP